MYNDKWLNHKQEVIPTITGSMIPVDFCQRDKNIINFTTYNMKSKIESLKKNNGCSISNWNHAKYWPHILDEYWDEGGAPY